MCEEEPHGTRICTRDPWKRGWRGSNECRRIGWFANVASAIDAATINNKVANFLTYTLNSGATGSAKILANSNTVFVLGNAAGTTYTAYTGIANVPDYEMDSAGEDFAVLTNGDGYAMLVVAASGAGVSVSSDANVVFVSGATTTNYNDSNTYYSWAAMIDGETTDKTVSATAASTVVRGGLYLVDAYDVDGRITNVYDSLTSTRLHDDAIVAHIEGSGNTMVVYSAASDANTGTTVASSYVVNDSTKYYVFDKSNSNSFTEYASLATLETLNTKLYNSGTFTGSLQVCEKSGTDNTLSYVVLTINSTGSAAQFTLNRGQDTTAANLDAASEINAVSTATTANTMNSLTSFTGTGLTIALAPSVQLDQNIAITDVAYSANSSTAVFTPVASTNGGGYVTVTTTGACTTTFIVHAVLNGIEYTYGISVADTD